MYYDIMMKRKMIWLLNTNHEVICYIILHETQKCRILQLIKDTESSQPIIYGRRRDVFSPEKGFFCNLKLIKGKHFQIEKNFVEQFGRPSPTKNGT